MKRNSVTVEDLMTTSVIALKATETVERAREDMELCAIRHIPVVDDRNHVIGIVSDRDLVRAHPSRHISELMTRSVRIVRPETPASEAASILIDSKFGSLPVVGEDEQLVGILTETDFLMVAQRALERPS
jgi:CBS domain-containing protein